MPNPLDKMPKNTPIKAVFSHNSHTLYVSGERRIQARKIEGKALELVDTFYTSSPFPNYPYELKGYQA